MAYQPPNPAGPYPSDTTNVNPGGVTPAPLVSGYIGLSPLFQPNPAGPIPSNTTNTNPVTTRGYPAWLTGSAGLGGGNPSTPPVSPGSSGGDPPAGPAAFDPVKYAESLTAGQAMDPKQAQAIADRLVTYLKGLPIGDEEKVLKELEKGPIQGTQIATDLYNALSGTKAGADGTSGGGISFDPFGLKQAFQTVIPQWLSKESAQGQKLDDALGPAMQQALKGASPAIQQAYSTIVPGMQAAESDENRAMAGLAMTTPMFNEMLAGIQAMNTAYAQAKQAALAAPYTAATVQGTGIPGTGTQTNSLVAGLQGPGIPGAGGTSTGGLTGATGTTAAPGLSLSPAINAQYYLNLAQANQATP